MFHKFIPGGEQDPIFDSRQQNGSDDGEGINLAELILEKIAAYEAREAAQNQSPIHGGGLPEDAVQIPAKALEVFEKYVLGLIGCNFTNRLEQSWFNTLPLQVWTSSETIQNPSHSPAMVYFS
jgi:essential nuclear protein 1